MSETTKKAAIDHIAFAGLPIGARLIKYEKPHRHGIEITQHTAAMLMAEHIRDTLNTCLGDLADDHFLYADDFQKLIVSLGDFPIMEAEGIPELEGSADEDRAQIQRCIQSALQLQSELES